MMRPTHRKLTYLLFGVMGLFGGSTSAEAQTLSVKLTQDPKGALNKQYSPITVVLTRKKPKEITKEPVYRTAPRYAITHVGNGPKSAFVFSLDEPQDADWKVYVDLNRNGDLTDDGDGAWGRKLVDKLGERIVYTGCDRVFRASYGDAKTEKSSANYGISFYRISNIDFLIIHGTSLCTGTLRHAGKKYNVTLRENDADGLYDKPIDDNGEPLRGRKSIRGVDITLSEIVPPKKRQSDDAWYFDATRPFTWKGKMYAAQVAPDGSSLKLVPTKRKIKRKRDTPTALKELPLLAKGVTAPDFTAEKWGGGTLKLSDYKGKVVVLDFWATWCVPCLKSMPHLEKVHKGLAGQEVVVLAVCVSDTRYAYENWVPEYKDKYTFQFAFDPAERDRKKSISGNLFQVSGIPTTYIIDKEGKVVQAIVGYNDDDKRIETVLKGLGIEVKE